MSHLIETAGVTRLLTETETARILSLKVTTLRRWRWEGKGPGYLKIGAAVRYDPAVIDQFIEESRRRSTSDTGPEAA